MHSKTTKKFRKLFNALPEETQQQASVAYRQFESNPFHKSLKFKRIHASLPLYSARISKGYRVVGQREENLIVWFWIGSHAKYDKLIARF